MADVLLKWLTFFAVNHYILHLFAANGRAESKPNKSWKNYFLSQTFTNDDDERWTKNLEHSLGPGANGFPRSFHAAMYLSSLCRGHIHVTIDDIKKLLIPLGEGILEEMNKLLNIYRNRLSQSKSPQESKMVFAQVERTEKILRFAEEYLIA